jgi:hypothetical protein
MEYLDMPIPDENGDSNTIANMFKNCPETKSFIVGTNIRTLASLRVSCTYWSKRLGFKFGCTKLSENETQVYRYSSEHNLPAGDIVERRAGPGRPKKNVEPEIAASWSIAPPTTGPKVFACHICGLDSEKDHPNENCDVDNPVLRAIKMIAYAKTKGQENEITPAMYAMAAHGTVAAYLASQGSGVASGGWGRPIEPVAATKGWGSTPPIEPHVIDALDDPDPCSNCGHEITEHPYTGWGEPCEVYVP